MEELEYIVFEAVSTGPAEEDFSFGTRDEGFESAPDAVLEVRTMTPREAEDERRAPGVVVAEPLPTMLIEPVATSEVAGPLSVGPTWGVEAVGATSSPFSGRGIKVAVLDTGIDASHPAFSGLTVTQSDFTGEGDGDHHGHGTHCAGTIAGRDVDGVRIGIALGIDELLVGKVLGARGGSTAAITSGMLWALQNGATVISMSLGIDFPGLVQRWTARGLPLQPATSQALGAYRDNLKLFGSIADVLASSPFAPAAVAVAATGNESERTGTPPYTIGVSPPAASGGFVRVGALAEGGADGFEVAPFSNTGATLAAPGVDVASARRGGGLTLMSGTSMATPHVAGVAALWAERLAGEGRLNAEQLMISLTGRTRAVPSLTTVDGGAGLVQAPA